MKLVNTPCSSKPHPSRRLSALLLFACTLTGAGLVLNSAAAAEACGDLKQVDNRGNISLPGDFRATYAHLGSWYVPEGDASGFHDVYLDPAALEQYRSNGVFPDGAILVKELRGAHTADYTTGANVASAVSSVKQTFVMIKDSCGRFPNNPVWGDGWGWALFKPGKARTNVAQDYRTDCLGCHAPARATDWVYIDAYPTLNAQ